MALPAQALERISRSQSQTPGAYTQLIMLALSILVLSGVVFAGLKFAYMPYLNSEIQKLDEQINKFSTDIPKEEQEKIAAFYSQIANLETVLAAHPEVTPFFRWLEENTMNDVYFSRLSLNTQNGQVALQGGARSTRAMVDQIARFESLPEVDRIVFGNLNSAETLQFNLTLFMDGKVWKGETPVAASGNSPVSSSTASSTQTGQ